MKAKLRLASKNNNFHGKSLALPISVGQKYHEGDKFSSTLKLIERKNFIHCSIIVADLLQRYNYIISNISDNLKKEDVMNEARNNGFEWIKRNQIYLDQFSVPYRIIRWDECINHKDFTSSLEMINGLLKTNKQYFQALKNDVERFIMRKNYCKKIINVEEKCINYIVEETAVIYSYFLDMKCKGVITKGNCRINYQPILSY